MSTLWAGDQVSYDYFLAAQAKAHEMLARGGVSHEQYQPELLQKQGSVGVVNVQGTMINGSAGIMSIFGMTGYSDVGRAAIAALSDPDIKSILLNVDTPGGQVAGLHDMATMLADIGKIKPVITYAGGNMLSAGMWLGAAGEKIYASATSEVGSIGVLMVLQDRSEAMAQAGIKPEVFRSGPFKALGNPYEKMSPEARAVIQQSVDDTAEVFLNHVASQRGVAPLVADSRYGQGRTFVGKRAKEVGLVDEIASDDYAFAYAQSQGW